jgi:hypothetical protein
MKIFISQPMYGKTNEQIREERKIIVAKLEDKGYEVVDSIVAKTPEDAMYEPVYYLSQSILKLAEADKALFMEGWENARGCKIEHDIVEAYGIPILQD